MIKLTRIYTRGGDKGKTSLGDGSRVLKNDPRIELIGTVDEVNATLGMVRLFVEKEFDQALSRIQHDLFDMGADLCLPVSDQNQVLRIQAQHSQRLEQEIDLLNNSLAPLTSFVLPGGSKASAYLHFARTVTRRAERLAVALAQTTSLNPYVITYLNRLSDYLFVLARFLNNKGAQDVLWEPGKNLDAAS